MVSISYTNDLVHYGVDQYLGMAVWNEAADHDADGCWTWIVQDA